MGYNCLYFWVLSPPVCLIFLSKVMSLFLSCGVGSLGRTLYVLVSCRSAWALVM